MADVTINTELGGHKAGATITVTPGTARKLIADGYAEAVEGAKSKPRGKAKADPEEEGGGDSPTPLPSTAG